MALGYGFNSYIGFGVETTLATPVASSKWLEVQKDAIKFKQTKLSKPTLRNVTQNHRVKSKKSVEGDFDFQATFEGAEILFKHTLGANSTTGPVSGGYTHAMSLAQVLPVGLTFGVNRDTANIGGSSTFQYAGCQINKLTLKQSMEDFLTITPSILGTDLAMIAAETPTFPTFAGIDYEMFACTIGGGAFACSDFEVTIDNSLAADRYKLGAAARKGLGRGSNRKVSGKISGEFVALADYNNYKNLATAAVVATWTGPLIGGAVFKTLTVTIPVAQFDGDDPGVDNSGPLKLDLPFTAYMNAADNDELTLQLINTTSSIP